MIKIIKRGTRDIRECESCGCLFSFDKEDISKDFRGNKSIKCPQCDKPVAIVNVRKRAALMPDGSMEMEA